MLCVKSKFMTKKRHSNIPASYMMLLKDNKILLLRRFNTGYEDGSYSLPAGHVDEGENFTMCVIRETKEEIGVLIKPEDVKVVHIMHRDSGTHENNERIDVFFIARKWQGKIINKEPTKCDNLEWFDVDNLPENVIPYIKQAIKGMKNKKYYSECGW